MTYLKFSYWCSWHWLILLHVKQATESLTVMKHWFYFLQIRQLVALWPKKHIFKPCVRMLILWFYVIARPILVSPLLEKANEVFSESVPFWRGKDPWKQTGKLVSEDVQVLWQLKQKGKVPVHSHLRFVLHAADLFLKVLYRAHELSRPVWHQEKCYSQSLWASTEKV